MSEKLFIQQALELVQNNQDDADKKLLALIDETGFRLKKSKIEKEDRYDYHEEAQIITKQEATYYFNKNKEALVLLISMSDEEQGKYVINMIDYKNRKKFSAYKGPQYIPDGKYCPIKLEKIPADRIEKPDLTFMYGFDFSRQTKKVTPQ